MLRSPIYTYYYVDMHLLVFHPYDINEQEPRTERSVDTGQRHNCK